MDEKLLSLCDVVVIISFFDTTHCPFLLFPLKGDDWTTVFKTEITVVESNFEIKIEKLQSLGQQAVLGKAHMIYL